jgi:hypothetical protein
MLKAAYVEKRLKKIKTFKNFKSFWQMKVFRRKAMKNSIKKHENQLKKRTFFALMFKDNKFIYLFQRWNQSK